MNLFELAAVLTLNKSSYDKGIKDAEKTAESFGAKIGNGLKTVGKITAAAVGTTATAVGSIVKQSISAYGEYEQLKGGIEALFGEEASKTLMNYSKDAFKNAQISANEYMSVITSFSGAIIKSAKDGQTAAKLSNLAVQDMADQANRYGKTVEEVSNTYTSLARGNYQTLDNLFGGMFAGTKAGLAEMLEYAEKYRASQGETVKYSKDSYADIVLAIHDVSEAMNVSGTSIDEAGTTVQGSINSVKAAWADLITGLGRRDLDAKGNEIGQMVDNLVNSAIGALNNLLPTIKVILRKIPTVIKELIPTVSEVLDDLISENLPEFTSVIVQLISSLATLLVENSDEILNAAFTIVTELATAFGDNADQLIGAVMSILDVIVTYLTDPEGLLKLIDVALTIIMKLAEGLTQNIPSILPAVVDVIMSIAEKLTDPDMLDQLVAAALELIIALAEGLISAQNVFLDKAPVIIANLVVAIIKAIPRLLSAATQLMVTFVRGIVENFFMLVRAGLKFVEKIKEGFTKKKDESKSWGAELMEGFINGLKEKWEKLKASVTHVVDSIKGIFTGKQGLDTHSPSKWGQKVFANLLEGAEVGLEEAAPSLIRQTQNVVRDVQDEFDNEYNPTVGGGSGSLAQILALLRQYLPQLSDMDVTLDTGALVGGLAPGIDAALGQRMGYVKRGVTA